jgi:hypothetical protein
MTLLLREIKALCVSFAGVDSRRNILEFAKQKNCRATQSTFHEKWIGGWGNGLFPMQKVAVICGGFLVF